MDTYQVEFYNLLSAELRFLLSPFHDRMKEQEWSYLSEMLEANELGVAFEGFCDFVSEEKVILATEQKNQVKILANAMKIDDRFWRHLA